MALLQIASPSTRTKALVAVYLISGFAGLVIVFAVAVLFVLAMIGRSPIAKIEIWPWLPLAVGLTIVAKFGAKWSARKDELRIG